MILALACAVATSVSFLLKYHCAVLAPSARLRHLYQGVGAALTKLTTNPHAPTRAGRLPTRFDAE